MEVQYEGCNKVKFKDVKPGRVFICERLPYIKVKYSACCERFLNAMCTSDGEMCRFEDEDYVYEVEAKLIVKATIVTD